MKSEGFCATSTCQSQTSASDKSAHCSAADGHNGVLGQTSNWGNIFPLTQTRVKKKKIPETRTQQRHERILYGLAAFLLYFSSHTVVYFPLLLPSVATFPHRHSQLSRFMSALSFIFRRTMPPRASITRPAFFSWQWEWGFHDTRAPAMANSPIWNGLQT